MGWNPFKRKEKPAEPEKPPPTAVDLLQAHLTHRQGCPGDAKCRCGLKTALAAIEKRLAK